MKRTTIPPPANVMSAAAPHVAVYIRVATDEQAQLAARIVQANDNARYFQPARRGQRMKGGRAQ
jgi:hypothetical protein